MDSLDITKIINDLNTWFDNYSGFIGIIGICGVFFTLLSYLRKDKISIKYKIDSSALIRDHKTEYSKLEIKYDGNKIQNLTASRVLIFNDGQNVLRKSDIAQDEIFGVKINEDNIIIEASIEDEISDSCMFDIDVNSSKSVSLKFNHINPKNAVLLHVLHTGQNDSLQICGKGAGLANSKKTNLDGDLFPVIGFFTIMTGILLYASYKLFVTTKLIIYLKVILLLIFLFLSLFSLYAVIVHLLELKNYFWLKKLLKKMN